MVVGAASSPAPTPACTGLVSGGQGLAHSPTVGADTSGGDEGDRQRGQEETGARAQKHTEESEGGVSGRKAGGGERMGR